MTVTVKELREALKKFDDNAPVCVLKDEGYFDGELAPEKIFVDEYWNLNEFRYEQDGPNEEYYQPLIVIGW